MRRVFAFTAALLILTPSYALAVTKSPTPTPIPKVSAKPTVKATTKATVKLKKKPVVKRVYGPRPKVSLKPAPKPVWPPNGFTQNGDIYAKRPTSKELLSLVSSNKKLSDDLKKCESSVCDVVLAASVSGCNWWEFNTDVVGPASDTDSTTIKYGSLQTLFPSSAAKQIVPFVLSSEEPVNDKIAIVNLKIVCHREAIPTDVKLPKATYVKES